MIEMLSELSYFLYIIYYIVIILLILFIIFPIIWKTMYPDEININDQLEEIYNEEDDESYINIDNNIFKYDSYKQNFELAKVNELSMEDIEMKNDTFNYTDLLKIYRITNFYQHIEMH